MKFSELSNEAKQRVYNDYCEAMNENEDDREMILSIDDYEAEADYIDLMFDAEGNVI